jgi:formate dehydrogenase iron-sulfur subunit
MAEGKSILVDTSRCTACRGCQVACKQWKGLPGTKTKQVGTYQNPQDLSADTWRVVRFADGKGPSGKPYWHFFPDQCRHCLDPPCLVAIEGYAKGGGFLDEKTGAVIYTEKSKKAPFDEVLGACPFNVPRQNGKTKVFAKCDLCTERLAEGMLPACVKACPTGALVCGDRKEILDMVGKRVQELKKTYSAAAAIDANDVRVIYIVTDDPKKYYQYAAGQ